MGANNKRKTTEQYKQEVFNLVGDKISVESEYWNCKTHVHMLCHTCDTFFDMSPDHFLRGYRCPKCSYKELGISKRNNPNTVKQNLLEKGYELLTDYTFSNTKIKVKRIECGHEFDIRYRDLYTERVICPVCRESTGEILIRTWLKENNFNFQAQYRIDKCRNIRPLPFDFAIINNDKLFLIEFNGIQHYENKFMEGYLEDGDTFEDRILKDKIKKEYCINNNIPLLVIKYDAIKKIPQILNEYFISSTTNTNSVYTHVSGNGDTLLWE